MLYFDIIALKWPQPMFDMKMLFKYDLRAGTMQSYHPMIASLNAELVNHRDNIDAVPGATIRVELPIPVQTDSATFSHRIEAFKGSDSITTQVMVVEMKSFETSYTVKESSRRASAKFR